MALNTPPSSRYDSPGASPRSLHLRLSSVHYLEPRTLYSTHDMQYCFKGVPGSSILNRSHFHDTIRNRHCDTSRYDQFSSCMENSKNDPSILLLDCLIAGVDHTVLKAFTFGFRPKKKCRSGRSRTLAMKESALEAFVRVEAVSLPLGSRPRFRMTRGV